MLEKLNQLSVSSGHLPRGRGMVSGVAALIIGVLYCLGVPAFHFPSYVTTPALRPA